MFPNLSVRRNISFGLDMRKALRPRRDRPAGRGRGAPAARSTACSSAIRASCRAGRGSAAALGRAIVTEPDAFLLDEPLAALDAALRVEMRTEIKLIQRKLATTMIFVTHDQEEALTVGDKIAVMKDGVVQQVDTPHDIYHRPANLFVGTFIGSPPINRFALRAARRAAASSVSSRRCSTCACRRRSRAGSTARRANHARHPPGVRAASTAEGASSPGAVAPDRADGQPHAGAARLRRPGVRVLVQGDPAVREGDRVGLVPPARARLLFRPRRRQPALSLTRLDHDQLGHSPSFAGSGQGRQAGWRGWLTFDGRASHPQTPQAARPDLCPTALSTTAPQGRASPDFSQRSRCGGGLGGRNGCGWRGRECASARALVDGGFWACGGGPRREQRRYAGALRRRRASGRGRRGGTRPGRGRPRPWRS